MPIKTYDVIIAGSGPCGAVAAYELAKHGFSVAIIEKEKLPRYKTCGGGVVYRARKLLPVDISPVIETEFHKAKLRFGKIGLEFEIERPEPLITMTMRADLDLFLTKAAARQGAHILDNCKLTGINNNGFLTIRTNHGNFRSKFLIGADGALGTTARAGGWKETRTMIPALEYEIRVKERVFEQFKHQLRFDIGLIPNGYSWLFPKARHLSAGVLTNKKGGLNLHHLCRHYIQSLEIRDIIEQETHGFQIPVSPRKENLYKNGILLAGDAAGLADPVVAEGITNAVLSGRLAAVAIIKNPDDITMAGKSYQQKIERNILSQLTIARHLADLLYKHPNLRDLLFKKKGERLTEAFADVFLGKRDYPVKSLDYLKMLMNPKTMYKLLSS